MQCSYPRKNILIDLIISDNHNGGDGELTALQLENIIFEFNKKNVCNGVNSKQCNTMFKTRVRTLID